MKEHINIIVYKLYRDFLPTKRKCVFLPQYCFVIIIAEYTNTIYKLLFFNISVTGLF